MEKGKICVLLGPSGPGKSTLLNIIGGIDHADSGFISINGEKTADMNENIEVGAYLSDKSLDLNSLMKTLGLYEHRNLQNGIRSIKYV